MYCRVYVAGEVTSDPVEVPLGDGKTINCFYLKTLQDLDSDGLNSRLQEIHFLIGLQGKANAKAGSIKKGSIAFAEGILVADHLTGGPSLVPRKDAAVGRALSLRVYSLRIVNNPANQATRR
jgi:hypothetical protein